MAVLRKQLTLILGQTTAWGLLCKWAPSSLLYALSREHCRLYITAQGSVRVPPDWSNPDPVSQPLFGAGLQNPDTSGYVGSLYCDSEDPENPDRWHFQRSDGNPIIWDDGRPGFTVPYGASRELKEELSHKWDRQYVAIQEDLRRQGAQAPKQRRTRDLGHMVEWLYQDLRQPALSWASKAKQINVDLDEEDAVTGGSLAHHVDEVRRLLHIDRPPDRKPRFDDQEKRLK